MPRTVNKKKQKSQGISEEQLRVLKKAYAQLQEQLQDIRNRVYLLRKKIQREKDAQEEEKISKSILQS